MNFRISCRDNYIEYIPKFPRLSYYDGCILTHNWWIVLFQYRRGDHSRGREDRGGGCTRHQRRGRRGYSRRDQRWRWEARRGRDQRNWGEGGMLLLELVIVWPLKWNHVIVVIDLSQRLVGLNHQCDDGNMVVCPLLSRKYFVSGSLDHFIYGIATYRMTGLNEYCIFHCHN